MNLSCIQTIRSRYADLTAAEQKIADCILAHGAAVPPQQWLNMNLTFRFRRSLLKTACAQCSALQATYAKRAA